jgi:hypothetical protein
VRLYLKNNSSKKAKKAWGMAQVLEHLPSKYKALTSNSSIAPEELAVIKIIHSYEKFGSERQEKNKSFLPFLGYIMEEKLRTYVVTTGKSSKIRNGFFFFFFFKLRFHQLHFWRSLLNQENKFLSSHLF